MNYISQLNSFYHYLMYNPTSSNAQLLYLHLLNINNKCNWRKDFTVANVTIQAAACLSRTQLDRARNELKQKGLIKYDKGTGNQAGKYLIVQFDTQVCTQTDTQVCTQSEMQMQHNCVTLDKLKLKPNETIKKSKPKNVYFYPPTLEEVEAYCLERQNGISPQRFIDYYTANGWLVGKNKMKDWKAAVRNWESRNKKDNAENKATSFAEAFKNYKEGGYDD